MMLKKLRRRFIAAAMAAIGAVTLVLLCAVNLWNYKITTDSLDATLDIMSLTGSYSSGKDYSLPEIFGGHSSEEMYMTRFFAVYYDQNGKAAGVFRDYIATVSVEQALSYSSDALSSGRERGYYGDYRYRVIGASGGSIVVFLNAVPEQQSMKTLLRVSVIVSLLALLAAFALITAFSKKATAPYMKNMQLQKQFITDAGHELKTPLTSISTSADVLKLETGENEWVDNIQKQAARMSKLVANLVTLSKLDEGAQMPDMCDFSLSDAAWEVSEPFELRAVAQGRKYSRSIEDNITVHGDMAAVQQMISILLDNAFKYSDEGGEIRLSVRKQHKGSVIEVYNTCAEGSLGDISRFFDRFYRADKARSADGGTGIGLSIARAVAEAHGGSISAESADGRSIVFRAVI
mgnify:FL=1